ncbi:unnamed protein product, partial [Larinioides sclopetarius]
MAQALQYRKNSSANKLTMKFRGEIKKAHKDIAFEFT